MAARAVVEAPVGLELLVGERGGNAPERLLVEVSDGRRGLGCDEFPQAAREHRRWLLPLHEQHEGDGPRRAGQGPLAELDDSVTYYHVETENHDVILAEGAAAETFIDYLDRCGFDNYQEYLDLYGAERVIHEMPLPRISAGRLVPGAIKALLGSRAPARPNSLAG